MKKEVIASVLSLILLASLVSATIIPIYVRPTLADGSLTPNTAYTYTLNWTTDSACSNVIYSNANMIVTTGSDGAAFFNVTIPDNITSVPSFMCEYRDGSLRAVHTLSGQIFDKIYASSINLSSQVYASGNITGSGGFFSSLGSILSRIASLFVTNIDANGNISAAYFLGNGSQLTGIPAGSNPTFANANISNLFTLVPQVVPTGANNGSLYFNSTLKAPMYYNGTTWIGLMGGTGGSIIASGNNSNGSYIQYADGTMIEWANNFSLGSVAITTSAGSITGLFVTSGTYPTWTFPISFVSVPSVQGRTVQNPSTYTWIGTGSTATTATTTQASYNILSAGTTTQTVYIDAYAIGRWTNLNLGTGSGGTGGIVNTITSAQGTCIEYSNGIANCVGSFGAIAHTTATSNVWVGTGSLVTFPIAFVQLPTVNCMVGSNSQGDFACTPSNGGLSLTGFTPLAYGSVSGSTSTNYYTATGYWTNSTNINTPDVSTWGLDSNGNIAQVNSSRNVNLTGNFTFKGGGYMYDNGTALILGHS